MSKLTSSERKKINSALIEDHPGLTGNFYYRKVGNALAAAQETMSEFGLETEIVDMFFLDKPRGHRALLLFDVAKQEWVTNSLLVLSWGSVPSGRVEVVAYLS
jgi:hypothetical protein